MPTVYMNGRTFAIEDEAPRQFRTESGSRIVSIADNDTSTCLRIPPGPPHQLEFILEDDPRATGNGTMLIWLIGMGFECREQLVGSRHWVGHPCHVEYKECDVESDKHGACSFKCSGYNERAVYFSLRASQPNAKLCEIAIV
jgi:hypothetical protein